MLQEKRIYEQAVLLDFSNQLLSRSKLADLMSYLAEEIPSLLGYDSCSILLVDDDSKYLCFWAASGWYNDPVGSNRRVPADNRTLSGRSMLSQEPIVVEDLDADGVAVWTAPWLYAEKFRGMAVVPLIAEGHSIGSLVINHRQPRCLNEAELSLFRLMANQAAIAIEKARLHEEEIKRQRLEDEMNVGHQIQLGLLPETCPVIEGWEFAAFYRPARQVGGDFYDFFELAGDPMQLGLVIADVAGKGVPAALFMALSRSLIRTKSMSGRLPAGVLSRANRLIYNDSRSKLFLTAFYATLDLRTGWLAYANAGHNRPLWVHGETGEIEELRAQGTVLGIFEHIELEQREAFIDPGDLIVLFTDGVTESMNEKDQLFGLDRLYTLVKANYRASPQEVIDAIVATVLDFTGGTPQADDLTLFVVKRKRETPRRVLQPEQAYGIPENVPIAPT
jgi:sigma-B regulation protein RsbU (phosphoserine phosphatase)